jgi:hypothetical protein
MCQHRPATYAGSRAGSHVSECVSPSATPLTRTIRKSRLYVLVEDS